MKLINRILVVDDNEAALTQIKKRLIKEGYDVELALNGDIAWEKFQKKPYPVVITDLRMPNSIDGLVVLKNIKEKLPNSQVIIVTGNGEEEDAIKSLNLHAFGYIKKGTHSFLSILINMVNKAIKEYEQAIGLEDWSDIQKPNFGLEEVSNNLKVYPSLSEAASQLRDKN